MQISLKWINELVNLETVKLEDLITKLTLGGFEVEEVLEVEIDGTKTIALDISATANRSDSLSIQGLSLEIAALLNNPPKTCHYIVKHDPWSQQLENLTSTQLIESNCMGFISVTLENLSNFQSPKWLQQKLLASGISPENNLLDFQNYISLETGYPIEVYDLEKIYSNIASSSFQLGLTSAKDCSQFLANNEITYSLDPSIQLLRANNLPISIAGIISSENNHYSVISSNLLVEASIFNAAKIRQESRLLGLRTNRSSRYEKSLKDSNLFQSLYRFISLLRISNPHIICKLHTIAQSEKEPIRPIQLDYKKVQQVLGPIHKIDQNQYEYLSPQIVDEAFERLNLISSYDSQNEKWEVQVPSLRSDDITRDIDLIEEIGRTYGFNNFLTRLPSIEKIGLEDYDYKVRKKVTSCLINLGLNELIQYSLVKEKTYITNDIQLINPLVTDYSNLRSSLLPNLLKASQKNIKKSNVSLEGFEYGHVFSNSSSDIVEEKEYLAGIFGGVSTKSNWSDLQKSISWFEAKGRIEQLFKKLNIVTYWKLYQPTKEKEIFHPYCTAELFLTNGIKLGIFGKISPATAKALTISTDNYLFEFNFELIKRQIQQNKLSVYQEYSSYPKILKDLSFIINKDIPFDNLREILYINGSQFLKEINLLDEYFGKSIPLNQTSLCLQLVFQSDSETLKNSTVDKIVNNLTTVLTKKFNATLRE